MTTDTLIPDHWGPAEWAEYDRLMQRPAQSSTWMQPYRAKVIPMNDVVAAILTSQAPSDDDPPFVLYISGPMRNYPAFNFPTFDAAAAVVDSITGWRAVSPAQHDRDLYPDIESWDGYADGDIARCPDFDFEASITWDIQQVTQADGIVLLPGWSNSTGARKELDVARTCGKHVYRYDPATHDILPVSGEYIDGVLRALTEQQKPDTEYVVDAITGGAKGKKLAQLGLIDPLALLELAKVAGAGAEKYEPYNFAKGYAYSLSFNAMLRHLLAFWSGESTDPDDGNPHLAHAAWHCLTLLCFELGGRGTDDRFPAS